MGDDYMTTMYAKLKNEVKRSVARLYTVYDDDLIENALTDSYLSITGKYDLPEDEMLPLWKHAAKWKLHNYVRDEYKERLVSLDSIAELPSPTRDDLEEYLHRQLAKLRSTDRRLVIAVLKNQIGAADDSINSIRRAMKRWFRSHIAPGSGSYERAMARIRAALNS